MTVPLITRFAPSPTGALHLGHAYAACVAHHFAQNSGGKMILRIDDLDYTRCRAEFTNAIFADLDWLGLTWHNSAEMPANRTTLPRQSQRFDAYAAALDQLRALGLVYPCYLSRRERARLMSAPHDPPNGSDGQAPAQATTHQQAMIDTDQFLDATEIARRQKAGQTPAWRLRMSAAVTTANKMSDGKPLTWFDRIMGRQSATPEMFGDAVIARADIAVSYHLSVVVDDALDQISLVTRGKDLAPSTHLHCLLQRLLGLPVPAYCHHPLVHDAAGNRLAKRDNAYSLTSMRQDGLSVSDILKKMPSLPNDCHDLHPDYDREQRR